jgi:AcrR family transcriptional regulator
MPETTHGERQRRRILAAAVDVASAEGLGPLSIGRLAAETEMSKSGVYAHFGSKEELQLGAVDAASADFERRVLAATAEAEPGLERLRALLEAWILHVERSPYRGGCFFSATSSEFASRSGAVRERLAERTASWLRVLEREARTARRLGEISADPEDLAFRLHAFVQEANWRRQLFDDPAAFDRARRAGRDAIISAPLDTRPTPHEEGALP